MTFSNSVSTTVQYDAFGNPVPTTDANGNQTQMICGPVAGFSGLYPTRSQIRVRNPGPADCPDRNTISAIDSQHASPRSATPRPKTSSV
ncbi:MAG: hypothetical protein IPK58_07475 [Acidobacteria bacterium]|nr:hypothetical protein [Acidobacteriota bacterium]